MIDTKFLKKLNGKLRNLREFGEFYGGLNVVVFGNFRKLDPVNATPIYKDLLSPSSIELHGMYMGCTALQTI